MWQYDPALPEHGYVRVQYRERLHDDAEHDTSSTTEMWHPLMEDEGGQRVSDPKGVLFMQRGIEVDLSQPPEAEVWKHGDVCDAEGLQKRDVWKKSRVMKDILRHRMLSFTEEQQDQWRALNEFHERFKCSDEVPNLPIQLRAGACVPIHILARCVAKRPLQLAFHCSYR